MAVSDAGASTGMLTGPCETGFRSARILPQVPDR